MNDRRSTEDGWQKNISLYSPHSADSNDVIKYTLFKTNTRRYTSPQISYTQQAGLVAGQSDDNNSESCSSKFALPLLSRTIQFRSYK